MRKQIMATQRSKFTPLTKSLEIFRKTSQIVALYNNWRVKVQVKMAADDIIKNLKIRVILAKFTLANYTCTPTCFRGLLECQLLLWVNVAAPNS